MEELARAKEAAHACYRASLHGPHHSPRDTSAPEHRRAMRRPRRFQLWEDVGVAPGEDIR